MHINYVLWFSFSLLIASMHCNLNTKAMADNTGREGEEALFEIIRSPNRPDDLNEANDGSQYLNNTGEGDDKIFDLDDRADEVMNYDYDYDNADNDYDDE